MLKGLQRTLIVTCVVVGGSYVFYEYVLSDRARNGLRFAVNALKESYSLISDTIDTALGIAVPDQDGSASAAYTEEQWERIGY